LLNQTPNKKPRVFTNIFLHLHPAAAREEANVLFVSELVKVDVGTKVERERYSKDQIVYV